MAIYLAPIVLGGLFFWSGRHLAYGASLLPAFALAAGGLLTSFTHLSTLRLRLTDRMEAARKAVIIEDTPRSPPFLGFVDEVATHLLCGATASAGGAFVTLLALNFEARTNGALKGVLTSLAVALAAYVAVVFITSLAQMYRAYVAINSVAEELDGTITRK